MCNPATYPELVDMPRCAICEEPTFDDPLRLPDGRDRPVHGRCIENAQRLLWEVESAPSRSTGGES